MKIYQPEGDCPYTDNVELSEASSHIAARDHFCYEAEDLLAFSNSEEFPKSSSERQGVQGDAL